MWQELEDEFGLFLDDMKRNETLCRYIDEDEYEDDYSHNEIGECQDRFIHRVKKWLHENKPGQYIVTSGWCVFVMTIDEARKRNLINWESIVVS
jgi:hypothetical protein